MMEHKILNLHFIISLQFAVLALNYPITLAAEILHYNQPVWQISNLYTCFDWQFCRTDFFIRTVKAGVASIFYFRQFFPVGITQIAGYGIERASMRSTFILGKANESLQRC